MIDDILDRPLSRLDLFSPERRREALDLGRGPVLDIPSGTLADLVSRHAAMAPHMPAVIGADGITLSYRALEVRADRLARLLVEDGIGPETIIGVRLERSPDLIVCLLAVLKAGAAYLPLDPAYPPDRLDYMIEDSGARLVITRDSLASLAGREPLPDTLLPQVSPRALAYVIYTSGSTGRPKGVMVEQAGLINLCALHQHAYHVTPASRGSQLASISFDAMAWEIWPYLTAGASIATVPPDTVRDIGALRDFLLGHAVTHAFIPTPLVPLFLEEDWPADASLRYCFTGGEQLLARPSVSIPFALFNHYGPTEATVTVTACRVTPDDGNPRPPAIGKPLANTQVHILDDRGEIAPIGVPGEIHIGGAGLARGYLNRPDLTTERFILSTALPGQRLYRTGDLGRYRADGTLEFLGRTDTQVKIRGYRIELGEVEATLQRLPELTQAVAALRPGVEGSVQLIAYVTPRTPAEFVERNLLARLRKWLPDHMIPSHLTPVSSFPLLPNGKIDRNALLSGTEPRFTERLDAKLTGAEAEICRLFTSVLGLSQIGADQSFFDMGGNSLLAVKLCHRLARDWNVRVPPSALYNAPTPLALAQMMGSDPKPLDTEDRIWLRPRCPSRLAVAFLPTLAGTGSYYSCLASLIEADANLVTCRLPGYFGDRPPDLHGMADIAAHCTDAMSADMDDTEWILAGWSFGGLLACETAKRMRQVGKNVRALILIDSYVAKAVVRPSDIDTAAFAGTGLDRMMQNNLRALNGFACDPIAFPTYEIRATATITSPDFGKRYDFVPAENRRISHVDAGHYDIIAPGKAKAVAAIIDTIINPRVQK